MRLHDPLRKQRNGRFTRITWSSGEFRMPREMANRERGEDVTVCTVKHLSGQDHFRELIRFRPLYDR